MKIWLLALWALLRRKPVAYNLDIYGRVWCDDGGAIVGCRFRPNISDDEWFDMLSARREPMRALSSVAGQR